jgi:hypothetical protein
VRRFGEGANIPSWKQSKFGHPGNWTEQSIEFCLRTFVDVTVKIQGAQWIPGPLERDIVYDQQIEALKDGVEIWHLVPAQEQEQGPASWLETLIGRNTIREVIRTLKRGETVRARVSVSSESSGNRARDVLGGGMKNMTGLNVAGIEEPKFFGQVLASEVIVTCVPSDRDYVKQYYSWLPTIDWEPE